MVFVFLLEPFCIRCGNDLFDLCHSPEVQMHLNRLSPKELHHDKVIYQPGSLRKVTCS